MDPYSNETVEAMATQFADMPAVYYQPTMTQLPMYNTGGEPHPQYAQQPSYVAPQSMGQEQVYSTQYTNQNQTFGPQYMNQQPICGAQYTGQRQNYGVHSMPFGPPASSNAPYMPSATFAPMNAQYMPSGPVSPVNAPYMALNPLAPQQVGPFSAPSRAAINRTRAASQVVARAPPPIAITTFARRDAIGNPIMPMFLIQPQPNPGVLHITANPFIVRINEVLVCLGQDALVMEYPQSSGIYGVHIIQERMTGKTMDIYIELVDFTEADKVFRRYNSMALHNRQPKLGNRRIKMEMATTSTLMKAIFPRAKCEWDNGMPVRSQAYLDAHNSIWDGFITSEELVKVQLFAEQPNSSKTRFAADSPERVYQFMITSLQKIPWHADRNFFPKSWIHQLHDVLTKMSLRLANLVREQHHDALDAKLLTQWMTTMKSSPMYGMGDRSAMENWMKIAEQVDDIMIGKFDRRSNSLMLGNAGLGTSSSSSAGAVAPCNAGQASRTDNANANSRGYGGYSSMVSNMPLNGYGFTSNNSSYRSSMNQMSENLNPRGKTMAKVTPGYETGNPTYPGGNSSYISSDPGYHGSDGGLQGGNGVYLGGGASLSNTSASNNGGSGGCASRSSNSSGPFGTKSAPDYRNKRTGSPAERSESSAPARF